MARFSRPLVVLKMMETGMIPVFYHSDYDTCKNVLEACYKGGVRVFEFTNRGDKALENFSRLYQFAAANFPDLMLGIGSIIDAPTSTIFMQAGADFIVAPLLREEMAFACNRRKTLWIPGCSSLSEISRAEELGAEIVKLFPASVFGPEFISSVKGPLPWTSIMPTGGVDPTEESLSKWFRAGAVCVGMGSNLITKEIISTGKFNELEQSVSAVMKLIKKLKP